jgi:hypothetical protein
VPAGVAPVVVIVSVEVAFPPVLISVEGLKEAFAPVGKTEVMFNGELQEVPFPLKFTVIV